MSLNIESFQCFSNAYVAMLLVECCLTWFSIIFYQRITVPQVLKDPWFKKGYKPPAFDEKCQTSLDDVDAAFGDSEVN